MGSNPMLSHFRGPEHQVELWVVRPGFSVA
jgi:hypothetical protein